MESFRQTFLILQSSVSLSDAHACGLFGLIYQLGQYVLPRYIILVKQRLRLIPGSTGSTLSGSSLDGMVMVAQTPTNEVTKPGYAEALEMNLLRSHGYLIGGEDLRKLLCYPSIEALRQAVRRGLTPVPVFAIPHRRGHFAIARDIATWMTNCRDSAIPTKRPRTRGSRLSVSLNQTMS